MRNIGLQGSKNTRDIAEVPSALGKIRPGMILRGGHLAKLTQHDVDVLRDDFHLKLVIDLRTELERAEKPDMELSGVEYRHMPLLDAETVGITHEQETEDRMALLSRLPDMQELYRNILRGDCLERFAELIGLIVDAAGRDGAILFHCSEGKDRTGITSLVLLSMLGASYDDIMADYLFTNEVARSRARRYYWAVYLLKHDKAAAERVRRLFLADPSYLDAAHSEILQSHESMPRFVEDALRISPERLQSFRDRMLIA